MNENEHLFGYENSNARDGALNLSDCMTRVYGWMAVALAISGGVAWKVAGNQQMLQTIFGNGAGIWILVLAELALVYFLTLAINKISASTALIMFFAYAVLNGISCSVICLAYTKESLTQAFLVTAGTFGATAIFGSITKRNLSTMGHAMIMGLIGLIIATIVNIFMKSEGLDSLLTYAGVLIFTGLTAYDSWKIKQIFTRYDTSDREMVNKYAVIGALELYLDFVNLFLYLLRALNRRK